MLVEYPQAALPATERLGASELEEPAAIDSLPQEDTFLTVLGAAPQDTCEVILEEHQAPGLSVNTLAHPLVVAVFVLFLGIFLEQGLRRRRRQREYKAWLHVVADEVQRNLRLLAQTDAYLFVGIIPSYSLSLFAPAHAFQRLSILSRGKLQLRRIFTLYFEYEHIQSRISDLVDLNRQRMATRGQGQSASVSGSGLDPLPNLLEATRGLARSAIQPSLALYNDLAAAIGEESLPSDYPATLHSEFQAAPEVQNSPLRPSEPLPPYELPPDPQAQNQ